MHCNREAVILDLLREAVSQAGKAAHSHPHRQVVALDMAGRGELQIRISSDDFDCLADEISGAITSRPFVVSVDFHDLREINRLESEGGFNRD